MSLFKKIFVLVVCLLAGAIVVFSALLLGGVVILTTVGAGLFILFCLIAAAIIICAAVYEKLRFNKLKNASLDLPEKFTYTAHTGCCETPMGSVESIVAGARYGAQIVELDLNFNAEGMAVLSHDDPTGAEITLDEAFRKVAEYPFLKVNVDVKSTANLTEVKSLAEVYGILDRIFYTGIFENDVDAVKSQTPDIPYYLNVNVSKNQDIGYINSLVSAVKNSGAIGINLNKKSASKRLADTFHKNGLLVSVWTANSEEDIYRLLTLAPDNITTKRPDRLQAILKERML